LAGPMKWCVTFTSRKSH